MSIEQRINYRLNQYPWVKKGIKRIYQRTMYILSPKLKSQGQIERISPDDNANEYFFGYYDKCPEDASGRYVLCLKAKNTWSNVAPHVVAEILLIDTYKTIEDHSRTRTIATTKSWNVQQGCMVQWIGPTYDQEIIYNDFRNGHYCSIILNVFTGNERELCMPVYCVSSDGKFALSLDFSRLHRLRPGYGYSNLPDSTEHEKIPNGTAIWKIDIVNNTTTPILSYTDFSLFEPRPEMKDAEHKVNHIMLNPSCNRFMVLHRWFNGQKKYTRLITVNVDGTEMFNLSDDDMVSHCYWIDNNRIIAYENKRNQGTGYYLMNDKSNEYKRLWPQIGNDGHPSYNPQTKLLVTDSYPNRARIASIKVMKDEMVYDIVKVFAPFKYDNDTRCDLHPRWSRDGRMIYFDSVYEGHRGLYRTKLTEEVYQRKDTVVNQSELVSCVIPSYKRSDTVARAIDSVLAQTYTNIEVCVVDDNNPGDEYSSALKQALKKYQGDDRVRYISQERHVNGAVARNAGIKAAKGKYVAFLDDDDEWLPTKIDKQVSILQGDSSVGGVTTLWTQYKDGKVVRHCEPYTADNFQFKVLSRQVSVFSSTVIIRKEIIDHFGGFDSNLSRHQDLQFLTDAASQCVFSVVPEYLVKLHIDSEINRPNLKKFIEAKEAFFKSVNNEIMKYDKKNKRRIKCAHNFEVAFAAIKSKKYGTALKYIGKVGIYPNAYKDLYGRYRSRKE